MADPRDLSWLTRQDLHPKADQALIEEFFEWTRAWHHHCLEGFDSENFLATSLHARTDRILGAPGFAETFSFQYFSLMEFHISHLVAYGQANEASFAAENLALAAEQNLKRTGDFFDQKVFIAKRHLAAASRQLGRRNPLKLLSEAKDYLLNRPEADYIRIDLAEPLDLRETTLFKKFQLDLFHEEVRIRIRDVLRTDTTHSLGRFPETVLPLLQAIRQFDDLYDQIPAGQKRPMLRDTKLRAEIFGGGNLESIKNSLDEEISNAELPWAERMAFRSSSALAHYFARDLDAAAEILYQCRQDASNRRLLRAVQNADDLLSWLNLENS